jgi:hypothetical protein
MDLYHAFKTCYLSASCFVYVFSMITVCGFQWVAINQPTRHPHQQPTSQLPQTAMEEIQLISYQPHMRSKT